ncbi:Uncharacterised protein [Mycobacteroides abscessus subsp. abscessus]|nr:Uncharacterised protein [Mycobacteroides abscessus subsp. abscessus]
MPRRLTCSDSLSKCAISEATMRAMLMRPCTSGAIAVSSISRWKAANSPASSTE